MTLLEGEREAILQHVGEILGSMGTSRGQLIPILQQVQGRLGYLPALAMQKIAEGMEIPTVDVYGIATFYNQFRMNPPGKHQFKVCMGTACYMVGGRIALESLERRLAIKEGETTPDREFSLERVACVGCCTMAPVVLVDEAVEGHVTPTRVDGILLNYDLAGLESEKGDEEEQKEGGSEA